MIEVCVYVDFTEQHRERGVLMCAAVTLVWTPEAASRSVSDLLLGRYAQWHAQKVSQSYMQREDLVVGHSGKL